ncbi:MAG: DUF4215 domain-containing protein [Deltaproteobacteria bacterium]|nr:DUF4215 domain-containing protein [Deltaproteobacteria bacterium]MBN2670642.1 DUF4215 domain-containing protein [Deltaproteobacteria bacterium]
MIGDVCDYDFVAYSKDESSDNHLKTRYYFANNGSMPLDGFTAVFEFTAQKEFSFDAWYTPDVTPQIENVGDNTYRVVFDYSNTTIAANTEVPLGGASNSGSFGINYTDWSSWNAQDDYFVFDSTDFEENRRILVYDNFGNLIFGLEPKVETCGDGIVDLNEQCDDGNRVNYDGCDEYCQTEPGVILSVYTRDESNESTLRFRSYVENNGSRALDGFYLYYYFSAEAPFQLEDWYTPDCDVSVEDLGGGNYRVAFDYSNAVLDAGARLPVGAGNSDIFGLHYIDYQPWDFGSDGSYLYSTEFEENVYMHVTDVDGNLLYGQL